MKRAKPLQASRAGWLESNVSANNVGDVDPSLYFLDVSRAYFSGHLIILFSH